MVNDSRRSILGGLAALGLGGAGCARRGEARGKLVIGAPTLRIAIPVFVAAERGLFRERGLDVELRTYPTAQPMIDDVVLGRLDAGGYAAYPIVLASARTAARPVHVATSLVEDPQHRLSYVLRKRGTTTRFPEDVRKKRIGILPTIAYQKWLGAILRAAHVEERDVTVVPIAPPMQAAALTDGGVDLLFSNDPMATSMIARDLAEVADDGPPCALRMASPFPFGSFVLGASLVEQRAPIAAGVVSALDAAILLLRAQPALRHAIAPHLRPEERPFVERYPESLWLTSGETAPSTLEEEMALERRLGILPGPTPVRAWAS